MCIGSNPGRCSRRTGADLGDTDAAHVLRPREVVRHARGAVELRRTAIIGMKYLISRTYMPKNKVEDSDNGPIWKT